MDTSPGPTAKGASAVAQPWPGAPVPTQGTKSSARAWDGASFKRFKQVMKEVFTTVRELSNQGVLLDEALARGNKRFEVFPEGSNEDMKVVLVPKEKNTKDIVEANHADRQEVLPIPAASCRHIVEEQARIFRADWRRVTLCSTAFRNVQRDAWTVWCQVPLLGLQGKAKGDSCQR